MGFFRTRRSLRRWCAVLAALWVFAVGVSVAHAGLVGHVAAEIAAADPHTGHPDAQAPHPSKDDCQSYCDRTSLTAAAKAPADNPVIASAAPQSFIAKQPHLSAVQAPLKALPDAGPSPPISVLFLRLAL